MTDAVKEIIEIFRNSGKDTLDLSNCGLTEIPIEVFDLKEIKVLRLKKNNIKVIPSEIKNLPKLRELNMIDNAIEELPAELFDVKTLQAIQMRSNLISVIPDDISKLPYLKSLNLADNRIEEIPEQFGNLSSLSSLYLKKNKIKRIPKSFAKLIKLKSFNIEDNPVEYPDKEIVKGGLMRIMIYLLVEQATNSANGFSFQVPNEMKTAVKQYLIYFQEYVEVAKGKKIVFEVRSTDDGIFIETDQNEDLEEMNSYFNEYLGFVKSNIDDLNPVIKTEISETKKELFVLGLKQQIHHLRQQIELKNFQINYLEKQVDDYFNLLKIKNSTPHPILINASSNALSSSSVDATFDLDLKVEIPNLQNELLKLKGLFDNETPKSVKDEIEILDAELLDCNFDDKENINKKPFARIKRIFEQLGDKGSDFNKVIEKSNNIKNSLQKLGKTYNKIAPWLAVPSIPEQLLNL